MPHTLHDDPPYPHPKPISAPELTATNTPVVAPVAATASVPTVTTETATTTTTTVTPSSASVPWYKSQRLIALVQSTVLWVLSWLVAALSSGDWAWKAVALGVATNVLVALKDWWNPNIVAPFAALNKNNVKP